MTDEVAAAEAEVATAEAALAAAEVKPATDTTDAPADKPAEVDHDTVKPAELTDAPEGVPELTLASNPDEVRRLYLEPRGPVE